MSVDLTGTWSWLSTPVLPHRRQTISRREHTTWSGEGETSVPHHFGSCLITPSSKLVLYPSTNFPTQVPTGQHLYLHRHRCHKLCPLQIQVLSVPASQRVGLHPVQGSDLPIQWPESLSAPMQEACGQGPGLRSIHQDYGPRTHSAERLVALSKPADKIEEKKTRKNNKWIYFSAEPKLGEEHAQEWKLDHQ